MNSTIVKQLVPLFAIVAIATLGLVALSHGINGALFGTTVATIAGIAGYTTRVQSKP